MKKELLSFIIILLATFTCYGSDISNETFEIKELNLVMVKCPAGSFMMGSPEEEKTKWFSHKDEYLHSVTITKPFYIGKYEVTQSQYSALMENIPQGYIEAKNFVESTFYEKLKDFCGRMNMNYLKKILIVWKIIVKKKYYSALDKKNPSRYKGTNNPVESITYEQANDYCEKLNIKFLNILPKGYKFALPTEAQWEYACRAGTNTALNNWKNLTSENGACPNLDEVGWYIKNSGDKTHEVGQKKPNSWGIYDMHGNVWEWCKNWYGEYPKESVTDPIGAISGSYRVARGGCHGSDPYHNRSACRRNCFTNSEYCNIGFRLALVPVD